MSNVTKAYAMIDGRQVNAVYNELTGLWSVEMTAPAISSWSQPGHVYAVSLYAEDQAGNVATMTVNDETYGDQLKIRVLETTKPVATILAPTAMSVIGTSTVNAEFKVSDEGESGINLSTIVCLVNGVDIASDLTWIKDVTDETADVYTAAYILSGLTDGLNTIELKVGDNDGNVSVESTVTFVVSTMAPTLEITSPMEGIITNGDTIIVSGSVSTFVSGVYVTSVTVNDVEVDIVDQSFTYEYSLVEGENVITIVATDTAGNSTRVIRHITLDSKAPIISDVETDSVVVDASGMIRITFKVTDATA